MSDSIPPVEPPPVDLALWRQFCCSRYPDVYKHWNYRGNIDRLNWDVCACSGQIFLIKHRAKFGANQQGPGFDTSVYWALDAIAAEEVGSWIAVDQEVHPAKAAVLSRIPATVRSKLDLLPGLRFVDVQRVRIWTYSSRRRPKQSWVKVDARGLALFAFNGGVGTCIAPADSDLAAATNRRAAA